ncbi:MAG: CobW family GTP-binding protein [Pseudomonadota bacterium]
MTTPLPVTVVGGYLGAGKTTLVNHLLRHAAGQRLAILVNEFGALPIDEDLIIAESDDLISIAGGCICCTFGSDLSEAMIALAAREPRPDHVVIESSGVAMPGAIGASLGLLAGFSLAGIVVLADSETVQRHADDEYLGDTTLRQLQDAHLIIQTKTDLVDAERADAVHGWLGEVNAAAASVRAAHGRVPNAVVLGQHGTGVLASDAVHADAAYESQVYAVTGARDPQGLAASIATGGYGVIRGKGFVTDVHGNTQLVQTVGARARVEPYRGEVASEIVCIGLRGALDTAGLDALFAAD